MKYADGEHYKLIDTITELANENRRYKKAIKLVLETIDDDYIEGILRETLTPDLVSLFEEEGD